MRQDQWQITASIDGRPTGVWATFAGGNRTADTTKFRPGAMAPEVALGGMASTGDVTLSRLISRDDWELIGQLDARIGKARVTISRQPLDVDGNPWGRAKTYAGILADVNAGDTDANSGDAQTWEITVTVEGS